MHNYFNKNFILTLILSIIFFLPELFAEEKKTSCCGVISPAGNSLLKFLDESGVEHLWLAHLHVNWETGKPDKKADYKGPGKSTHCSAFAAAMAKRLNIYMLRPPEHGQILLANAQARWFGTHEGIQNGWKSLTNMQEAQKLANEGNFIVATFQSPNPKKPGHIAIIRPAEKTLEQLLLQGPDIIQAGSQNKLSWNVKAGFEHHKGAWPNNIKYFYHSLTKISEPR